MTTPVSDKWKKVNLTCTVNDNTMLKAFDTMGKLPTMLSAMILDYKYQIAKNIDDYYFMNARGDTETLGGNSWAKLRKSTMRAKRTKDPTCRLEQSKDLRRKIKSNTRKAQLEATSSRGGVTDLFPSFDGVEYVWFHEYGFHVRKGGEKEKIEARDFIRKAAIDASNDFSAKLEKAKKGDFQNTKMSHQTYMGNINGFRHAFARGGTGSGIGGGAVASLSGSAAGGSVLRPSRAPMASTLTSSRFTSDISGVSISLFSGLMKSPLFWLFGMAPPSGIYKYVGIYFTLMNALDAHLLTLKSAASYGKAMAMGRAGVSAKIARRSVRRRFF